MKPTQTRLPLLTSTRRHSFPARPSPPSFTHKSLSQCSAPRLPAFTPFASPLQPTQRVNLPPLIPKKAYNTSAYKHFPPVPTLTRRFMQGEELLKRIPCEDLMEALLGGEPFADTVLVNNLVRLRKRTESETVLKEEDTDDSQSP